MSETAAAVDLLRAASLLSSVVCQTTTKLTHTSEVWESCPVGFLLLDVQFQFISDLIRRSSVFLLSRPSDFFFFFFVLLQVIRLELEPELFGSPAVNAPTAARASSPTYVSLYCVFFLLIFTQLLQIVQFLSFRVRRWSTPFTLPDTECKKKKEFLIIMM